MSKKEFVILLLITFFVVMVWIVADIIHSRPSVTLDPKVSGLLEPVNSEFDLETLKKVDENFASLTQVPTFSSPVIQSPIPTTFDGSTASDEAALNLDDSSDATDSSDLDSLIDNL